MFGPAGRLYVYFVYGMHFCANVVCLTDGVPGAVLLRAGEVVDGVELARARRASARSDVELAKGPARLTSVLGLDRDHNGANLTDTSSPVRLLAGDPVPAESVRTGPRVGVATAHDVPWRYWVDGVPAVTTYRKGTRRRSRT
jgi:DNA-3-methyladenine glycosylase